MRKTSLKLAIAVSIAYASTYILPDASKENALDELMTSNIEALASGEGEGSVQGCVGSGTVNCHGYHVQYRFDGLSLDDFE